MRLSGWSKLFADEELRPVLTLMREQVREMQSEGQAVIDKESRELLAVHHTGFIVAEAGQIYRGYTNSDHGIDGEIEFKDDQGRASGSA